MQIEPERFDLIGELAAGYPSETIAERTIEVYASDLVDIPLEVLSEAVRVCRSELIYFPKVAQIRERAALLLRPDSSMDHPASCKCFGTNMFVPEGRDPGGYTFGARRCDGVVEGFITPPDADGEDVSMF